MTQPLPIFGQSLPAAPVPHGLPFLRLAFRPFYLGAALLAALIVPLWTAIFLGTTAWQPAAPALMWHAHEMLFGFSVAVIIGFLMTAGKSWTGLQTPRGLALGALFAVWFSARVASLGAPYALFAALDLALLPLAGLIFLRLLIRSKNWRNVPLALILLMLAVVNLTFHLSVNGIIDIAPMRSLYAGLAFIVMIECVMAGRVVPFFTASAMRGIKIDSIVWLDRSSLVATGLGLAFWVTSVNAGVAATALALAFIFNLVRQLRWHTWSTYNRPILWVLHLAHLWLSFGLGLLALGQLGLVPISIAVHALGVGATGGLIIGMMTRTARGHTGQALTVGVAEWLAYALIMLAAILRVALPLFLPSLYAFGLVTAAVVWSAGFLIFLIKYTPWLVKARADGKDG